MDVAVVEVVPVDLVAEVVRAEDHVVVEIWAIVADPIGVEIVAANGETAIVVRIFFSSTASTIKYH